VGPRSLARVSARVLCQRRGFAVADPRALRFWRGEGGGRHPPPARSSVPVPGCKNVAAPIYGMVCSEHKDVPKAKIKQYRAARKAAKAAGKGQARAKPAAKAKRKAKQPARTKGKTLTVRKTRTPAAGKIATEAAPQPQLAPEVQSA
jgi:hypothetical protein